MAVYINRSQAIAERLVKLRDYLYANASPTHAVRMKDILSYLASERIDVEVKTVYSDLHTLKNFFKLDIDYDGRQKGYILNNPLFEPYELRMIVNSIQAARFITQQEADRLTDKIMRLADRYTRPSLNRHTFVKNRVHTINEDAMKELDTIYEAIANDRKISFRYFQYKLSNFRKSKVYHEIENSKIIIASPYWVSWEDGEFWVYVIREGIEDMPDADYIEFAEEGENGEGQDYMELIGDGENEERIEEPKEPAYIGPLTPWFLELEHMEQIKILPDARQGKEIAQRDLEHESQAQRESNAIKTRLKVSNSYIFEIMDKFGEAVTISPKSDDFFIATICGKPSPELYMWTRTFYPPIEIVSPADAEAELQKYFFDISQGNFVMSSEIYDILYKD